IGLGLATVHDIVKQSNGYIWAFSELGVGTTFTVYLPRVEAELDSKPSQTARDSEPARGTETVLLVDDEPAIRTVARTALERLGYEVLVANAGPDARRIAREHRGPIHPPVTDAVVP